MKQFYFILISSILIIASSCSTTNKYSTRSTSVENEAFILILSDNNQKIENVSVIIDQTDEYVYPIVFPQKRAIRMKPIVTTPGSKNVKVIYLDRIVFDQNILLGHGETRKIMVR